MQRLLTVVALAWSLSCLSSPEPHGAGGESGASGGGMGAGAGGESGAGGGSSGGGSGSSGRSGGSAGSSGIGGLGGAGFPGFPGGGFPGGGFPGGGFPGGGFGGGSAADCTVCAKLVACCAAVNPGDPLCSNAESTCRAAPGPARTSLESLCMIQLNQLGMQFPAEAACN